MMQNIIKKLKKLRFIFLLFSVVNIVYIVFCDIFTSFSISMNIVFVALSALNFLIYLILRRDYEFGIKPPSFIIVFIQIFYLALNFVLILLFIINISYKKNVLSDNKNYDYIIVFGAGVKTDEERNFIINIRLNKALEYATKYKKATFILTGAKVDTEPIEEAMYMKNYLISNGIELDRIRTEIESTNTYQNLYNSYTIIEKDMLRRNRREGIITTPFDTKDELFDLEMINLGLMSSDFHLTRLSMMSKKLGVKNPYVISADTALIYKPYFYIRESLSLFKAWVLGELKLR